MSHQLCWNIGWNKWENAHPRVRWTQPQLASCSEINTSHFVGVYPARPSRWDNLVINALSATLWSGRYEPQRAKLSNLGAYIFIHLKLCLAAFKWVKLLIWDQTFCKSWICKHQFHSQYQWFGVLVKQIKYDYYSSLRVAPVYGRFIVM